MLPIWEIQNLMVINCSFGGKTRLRYTSPIGTAQAGKKCLALDGIPTSGKERKDVLEILRLT
jgi:hypothetical protein